MNAFLSEIRRGNVQSVGIFADWLEDRRDNRGPKLRAIWRKAEDTADWFRGAAAEFFHRKRYTRWEAVASWHRWLRQQVAKLFRLKWRDLTRAEMHAANS
jgi:hypothetical protein